MNVLAIVSSPRPAGNTHRLVALALEQLREECSTFGDELEAETVSLARLNIKTCVGCRACFDKGEDSCPLQDDVPALRDKLLRADALILASPVFVEDVNGILKNWIDRMAYGCHRPPFCLKKALVLTTSGGGASSHALRTMASALVAWGFHIVGKRNFRMGAVMDDAALRSQWGDTLRTLVHKLVSTTVKAAADPAWYSLMAFTIQQRFWRKQAALEPDTLDARHWRERGWLQSGCKYYAPIRSSPVKVALARLIGRTLALFFI